MNAANRSCGMTSRWRRCRKAVDAPGGTSGHTERSWIGRNWQARRTVCESAPSRSRTRCSASAGAGSGTLLSTRTRHKVHRARPPHVLAWGTPAMRLASSTENPSGANTFRPSGYTMQSRPTRRSRTVRTSRAASTSSSAPPSKNKKSLRRSASQRFCNPVPMIVGLVAAARQTGSCASAITSRPPCRKPSRASTGSSTATLSSTLRHAPNHGFNRNQNQMP